MAPVHIGFAPMLVLSIECRLVPAYNLSFPRFLTGCHCLPRLVFGRLMISSSCVLLF